MGTGGTIGFPGMTRLEGHSGFAPNGLRQNPKQQTGAHQTRELIVLTDPFVRLSHPGDRKERRKTRHLTMKRWYLLRAACGEVGHSAGCTPLTLSLLMERRRGVLPCGATEIGGGEVGGGGALEESSLCN